MAAAKVKLKAAREAIGSKDWPKAEKAAREVLDLDPDSYNGCAEPRHRTVMGRAETLSHRHVFLGLALASQGRAKAAAAEQAYQKATALSPKQLLAWQGLATMYEEQGKAEEEAQALIQIMDVCNEACVPVKAGATELMPDRRGDAQKLGETLQKLQTLRKQHGSRTEASTLLLCPDDASLTCSARSWTRWLSSSHPPRTSQSSARYRLQTRRILLHPRSIPSSSHSQTLYPRSKSS